MTSLLLMSCADPDELDCPADRHYEQLTDDVRLTCGAAQVFAARDVDGIVLTQEFVREYFVRWRAVLVSEPVLKMRWPQVYRNDGGGFVSLYTNNALAKSAWLSGDIATGDAILDGVVAEVSGARLAMAQMLGDGTVFAYIYTDAIYNEERLESILTDVSTHQNPVVMRPQDDGTWTTLSNGDSEIDFRFGWGDCASGCFGFHNLRAVVDSDLHVIVYDMGGDPLPDGLTLADTTQPPP
ncbi:MAG: hypothetical protein NT062_36665 [Proteobacteria bacterium]|nr:hypothetical protein [Pseudomonadota bacterium]